MALHLRIGLRRHGVRLAWVARLGGARGGENGRTAPRQESADHRGGAGHRSGHGARHGARGAQVLATDVNATLLLDLEAEEGLTTASLDVTNASQIARLAEAQGALDVLVNVTGFVHHGSILE